MSNYSFKNLPDSSSSSSGTPSAPPLDPTSSNVIGATSTAPPDYEDAISKVQSSLPFIPQQPSPKSSELIGYVQVESIANLDTSSASSTFPSTSTPTGINLDEQQQPFLLTNDAYNQAYATGNYDNEAQEPLLYGYDDQQQQQHHHQLIQMQQQQENHANRSQYYAQFQANNNGLLSRDRHLNRDGEALARFLQQHNTPPHMKIRLYGYHDETYYRTENICDKHGNLREERQPVTKRVVDFNFDLDCSDAVSRQCIGVYVLPDPKTSQVKTVRQLCDDYVRETSAFKELHLTKVISWDYTKLTEALTTAIRTYGYYHSVDISYELTSHTVAIKTDSNLSKMADHRTFRWFIYCTCLFFLTWPYLWLTRKRLGYLNVKSEWKMKSSEREWYDQHIQQVLCQIPPPSMNQPSINQPSINQPSINQPSINQPSINQPSINQPSINQPSINQPSINQPSVIQPFINQPSINQPSINQPSINQPSINQPSINQPFINQPSINQPSIV